MRTFFSTLAQRSELLYTFGWISLAGAALCILLSLTTDTEILGINAWIKPLKFYLSTTLFVWAIGWFIGYLPSARSLTIYEWSVVGVLGFELAYITYQAAVGDRSHFNGRTAFHAFMFGMMGTLIGMMTLFTGWVGYKFFSTPLPQLAPHYLWAIRWGMVLFVLFAFEGFVMGQNGAHTVGAADGVAGLPFLNWSITHGDLRVAHFVGMHALQLIPLLSYYVLKNTPLTHLVALLYLGVAGFVLWQALGGKPLHAFGVS